MPWRFTIAIIAIIASEIITICSPIGTPLTTSERRITGSGRYSARSRRPIHSGCRRQRSHSSIAGSAIAFASRLAHALPATPSAGSGPAPNISSGTRKMSSTTASSRNTNGVRVSPAPRRIADRNANAYSSGSARKKMRRYATASASEPAGVPIHASSPGASDQPSAASTPDRPMKNVALVPMARRAP